MWFVVVLFLCFFAFFYTIVLVVVLSFVVFYSQSLFFPYFSLSFLFLTFHPDITVVVD